MINVLFVDDEKLFQESLIEGFITYADHIRPVTARNGEEAVMKMETCNVDMVVTDLKMPVMDGFQLIRFLNEHYPHVPVIVMTAFGDLETADRLKSLGVSAYIDKPADLDEIMTGIAKVLKRYKKQISWINTLMGIS